MHCANIDCDKELTDFEATRKWKGTNVFLDLCNNCFYVTSIPPEAVSERYDLYNQDEEDPEGGEIEQPEDYL